MWPGSGRCGLIRVHPKVRSCRDACASAVLTGSPHETEVGVERDLPGFVAGFVIATITSPVGVSGAVFLLPVQVSLLGVPNPQVPPTTLLYNVLSGPGALLRYARQRQLRGPLAR